MGSRRLARRDAWLVFASALAIRLAAAAVLDGFRHPEIFEYDDIARAIASGRGFSYYHLGVLYHSYTAPLFSWLSALVYLAGGMIASVMVMQMAIGSAQAALVAVMADRLFRSRRAGIVAGLLVAAHPGFVVYASAKAHTLVLDAFFFTLIPWMCWRLFDRRTAGRAVALGLVVGLGALSRGTAVVFLPIAGAWMLWAVDRREWPTVVARYALAAVCATLVIAPWSVRNTRVNGEFVWMLSTEGEDLWDGNNPAATGHSYVNRNLIVLETLTDAERRDLRSQPTEMAQSRWFRDRALAFIRGNPGAFVTLTIRKFFYFWWFGPQSGMLYAREWLRGYQVFYVGVLALAAAGARAAWVSDDRDSRRLAVLLLVFALGLSVLQSLYYVEGRHRWAVESLILVLAGGGMASSLARRWGGAALPSRPPR
jgi:4-amino-4-deoxy-L-arabinose transferase-like glycosyltransferase